MVVRRVEGFPYNGYSSARNFDYIKFELLKIVLISGLAVENFENYSIDEIIEAIEKTFYYNHEISMIEQTEEILPVYMLIRKHRFFLKEHCKRLWFWKQLAKFEVENV